MKKKLRAVVFSSEYPPHIFGGLGTHVEHITETMADAADFELFLPKRPGYRPLNPSVHIREVAVEESRSNVEFWIRYCGTSAPFAAEALADARTLDVIHCHDWMTVLAGVRLKRLLPSVPLVYSVHLPQNGGEPNLMECLGLVNADLIVVNSHAVARELRERGLPLPPVEIVSHGVDAETFRPAPDWPSDDGYILFAGRVVAQKGVNILLRAFGALLRRCPEARLLVVGEGDLELFFQRMTRYLGFPHRVSFVEWQTGESLVGLYQRAQLIVIPSYYEPFGIVALEAMACGRPLVASRVGGLAEIVEDGVQGYLFPVGDHLELARRLAQLILDPARREKMGAAARERATQFTWGDAAARTEAIYARLDGHRVADDAERSRITLRLKRELAARLDVNLRPILAGLLDADSPPPSRRARAK